MAVQQEVVLPAVGLLQSCERGASDGTLGGELQRLAELARCELDNDVARRQWYADAAKKAP